MFRRLVGKTGLTTPNPRLHISLCKRSVIELLEVITFKMDFRPSGFDRPVTGHFKDQIVSKLAQAGIATLTVVIKRGLRRELVLDFEGADEDVERAKVVLNKT